MEGWFEISFPPDILKLELEAFPAARTVVVNNAFADPVSTLSALVAGGSYATDCLFVVLAGPCDSILLEHPRHEPRCNAADEAGDCCDSRRSSHVSLAMYADDLCSLATGPKHLCAGEAASLQIDIVTKFEGALKMKLSRAKLPWMIEDSSKSLGRASSKAARKRPEPSLQAIGSATVKICENLCIDVQTGGRLVRAKHPARVRSVQARMGRFVRLGVKAGPCLQDRRHPRLAARHRGCRDHGCYDEDRQQNDRQG